MISRKPQGPTLGFVDAHNASVRKRDPLGLALRRADPQSSPNAANPDATVLLRLDAEIVCPGLRIGRNKGSFAEVIQAMIGAQPNAIVSPISKDGLDPIGGQAIALGKRFHLPFRMTQAKGIAKCRRIQALDPAVLIGPHPEISSAIKSETRISRNTRSSAPSVVDSPVGTRRTLLRFLKWADSRTSARPIFSRR